MPTGLSDLPPADEAPATPGQAWYAPSVRTFDEAHDPAGRPRPHWAPLFGAFDDLGSAELARRWRDAQHLIRENGVTYNVYGDPRGMARPWQLDPIPLVIGPAEAAHLERGLVQRARLLELVLADLYGPQRLLQSGLLPPELVFPNPGFLRPCHGIRLPGGRFLHLYAANLGRSEDGHFHVLGDRTQAPSGAGYALENRIVMTRTLPEAFRDCRVQRLALFFRALRDTLRAIAPRNTDNPRIVLLTPGPYNETYFEHAYLARYLGHTLVEGGDLTVRDGRVFLKVLGGLQPVDVIFRRLDDDYCDPLELGPDSFLGVPGLTQAVRRGKVAVANALGSGLLETPALMAYLPTLCRDLLGEDLWLPSVPTWWCGDPDGLKHVMAHLDDVVVKPTFPAARVEPVFPADLTRDARATLVEKLRARPHEYVAQARLELSTAPVLAGDRPAPRRMVLRTYLAADGDGFAVMPGGLTRVSSGPDTRVVSMQRGGGSKDTWVLAAGPVSDFSLLPAGGRVELTRAGGDLPSRAADNLFWLGRYAERAEGTSRLLRSTAARLAGRAGLADAPDLSALLRALALYAEGHTPSVVPLEPGPAVADMVFDPARPGSLASVVREVRRVAGAVRDLISTDMWRVVNGLADAETELVPSEPTPATILDRLNRVVVGLAAFGGFAVEGMTRGEGWRFLDLGRRMERCLHTMALLRGALVYPAPNEGPVLDAVLEVADCGMTYRRRYLGTLRAEAVLDLVVLDESNPRSLASQMAALEEDVSHMPRPAGQAGRGPGQRLALGVLNTVRLAEADALAAVTDATRLGLRQLLEELAAGLPALSDAVTQQYLSHLQPSRHLAGTGGS